MKKSLVPLLSIAFLCIVFFACSDNSLDLGEAVPKKLNCYVQSEEKCYLVIESVCTSINGNWDYKFCGGTPSISSSSEELDLSSSSSEPGDGDSSSSSEEEQGGDDSSSSSEEQGGDESSSSVASETSSSSRTPSSSSRASSSSSVPSSSSAPSSSSVAPSSSSLGLTEAPNLATNCGGGYTGAVNSCNTFRFRNFDFPSSGAYLDTTGIYTSRTSDANQGGSQLYHDLTAAESCGSITIELEGGILAAILEGNGNKTYPTGTGTITARAVATCNGTKVVLATTTALVISSTDELPITTPSWECSIPPYVGITEDLTQFLTLKMDERDDSSRCAGLTKSASNVTVGTGRTLTITTSGSCTGTPAVPAAPSCTRSVTVANNYVLFTKINVEDSNARIKGNNSSTVIEFSADIQPNNFGCDCYSTTSNSGENCPSGTNVSFTMNGTACSHNNNWWVQCSLSSTNYPANGNRILFNTTITRDLRCTPN